MTGNTVVDINRVRERGNGQIVDIEVTLADGSRSVIAFAYAKVALVIRELLIGHLAAAVARDTAGTLDTKEHAASFAVRRAAVELLPPNHTGLALFFDDDAVLPIQLDSATARILGERLLAVATELEATPAQLH